MMVKMVDDVKHEVRVVKNVYEFVSPDILSLAFLSSSNINSFHKKFDSYQSTFQKKPSRLWEFIILMERERREIHFNTMIIKKFIL